MGLCPLTQVVHFCFNRAQIKHLSPTFFLLGKIWTICTQRTHYFWDVYTIRKWTNHSRTRSQKCILTKRNIETNYAFQKHLYNRVNNQQPGYNRNKTLFAKDAYRPFTILACLLWLFVSCSLRLVETESSFLYTATDHFHDFAHG